MNVAQALERSARFFPDHAALQCKGREWSYAELEGAASRAAGGFARLGLESGDRACLLLPNGPEFLIAYYGLLKLGAIPISLNVMLKADEVAYIAGDAGARLFLAHRALLQNLPSRDRMPTVTNLVVVGGEAPAAARAFEEVVGDGEPRRAIDLERDATAAILYTSGTTGRPKGAMLSHANVVANSYATNHCLEMTTEDRLLCALPLFHVFGQNFIMNASVNAASTLLLHERFVPDDLVAAFGSDAPTIFYGVPTMFIYLLNDPRVTPELVGGVRTWFSAAATMPQEVSERWHERFGRSVAEGYGLTECSPFACYNHEWRFKFGSVGTPVENVEVKILDAEDREVPVGELGEICIRGPIVMQGYFGRPEDTAQALRGGWLHSGDLGKVDEDGYVFIVDRVKDMINVAGFKVYPREVEEVLFTHRAVKEAAVVGMPDALYGEQVKAFVVTHSGADVDPDGLIVYCRERIAEFKVPRAVELVEALPKSPTGKVLKRELRGDPL